MLRRWKGKGKTGVIGALVDGGGFIKNEVDDDIQINNVHGTDSTLFAKEP